jgi:hypothetical protein
MNPSHRFFENQFLCQRNGKNLLKNLLHESEPSWALAAPDITLNHPKSQNPL